MHVIVQRGDRFQTARVCAVTSGSVTLLGGWHEGGFGPAPLMLVAKAEVATRLVAQAPGKVTLSPAVDAHWPPRIHEALRKLVEAGQ